MSHPQAAHEPTLQGGTSTALADPIPAHDDRAVTVSRTWRWLHPVVRRLAVGHFAVDWFSNTLPPLLPLLVPRLGLTLAGTGALAMVLQLSTSVAQVLFGGWADRGVAVRLARVGLVCAALGLGTIGLLHTWWGLVAALVVGGLGVAAYHPPGAMLAHRFHGGRPGHSMAAYVTSGTIGFALGPLVVAGVAQRFGIEATAWLTLPVLALGLLGLHGVTEVAPPRSARRAGFGFAALRPYARPLTLLYFVVVIRGFVGATVSTFLPVMLVRRGASVTLAAGAVTAFFLGGGIGGFFGGSLADRFGHRRVILQSMLLAAPFLFVAPLAPLPVTLACLTTAGVFLGSTLAVNVSFGQLIAPVGAATVASLLMGFAWGLGGLLIPIAGMVADRAGLETTMMGLGFVPLVGAALAWPLPRSVSVGGKRSVVS